VKAAFERTLTGEQVRARVARAGRTLAARTIPLTNKEGHVFAGIALLNDITERVTAEQKLQDQAKELEALSLTDELTGLHNRRGFVTLAGQELKLAARHQRNAAVVYIDVNDLKPVNDQLGHDEGDRLLKDVAKVLRGTFRDSDVVARLGGDEFAIFTVEIAPHNVPALEARLAEAEHQFNATTDRRYELSLSIGTEVFDPSCPDTLDDLLARADERMYERKLARKQTPRPPPKG